MRAVRQFNVVPAIPAPLQALSELAANLHWTWDSETRALFRSLDPVAWKATGEDPLHVVRRERPAVLAREDEPLPPGHQRPLAREHPGEEEEAPQWVVFWILFQGWSPKYGGHGW